jgi:hypothetical protein
MYSFGSDLDLSGAQGKGKSRRSLPMSPGCLLDSINTIDVVGHRDKALLATLAYTGY